MRKKKKKRQRERERERINIKSKMNEMIQKGLSQREGEE